MRRFSPWLVLALAGCPRGGGHGTAPHGEAADGLAIAIYSQPVPPDAPPPAPQYDAQGQPIPPPPPVPTSVALIDDRRTIEVGDDGSIHLPDVADGIELASLIVEPLDGAKLDVHTCVRELDQGAVLGGRAATLTTEDGVTVDGIVRKPDEGDGTWVVEDGHGDTHFVRGNPEEIVLQGGAASEVRCAVDAASGQHRVRLAYATSDLAWTASYRVDVAVGDDEAARTTVQPTFTIAGSQVVGARHAAVSLLVGLPGGDITPHLAWSGEVDLGGDEVAVQPAARTLASRFEHIYRGAVVSHDDNPRDYNWRPSFMVDVWDALGITPAVAAENLDLPGGPALFTVGSGGDARQSHGRWPDPDPDAHTGLDVQLWPSHDLVGYRERRQPYNDGSRLIEQYLFSVSNQGDQPVTVWVEEELRSGAAWREVRKAWPVKAHRHGDMLRFPVKIAGHHIERLGFEAEYRWQ